MNNFGEFKEKFGERKEQFSDLYSKFSGKTKTGIITGTFLAGLAAYGIFGDGDEKTTISDKIKALSSNTGIKTKQIKCYNYQDNTKINTNLELLEKIGEIVKAKSNEELFEIISSDKNFSHIKDLLLQNGITLEGSIYEKQKIISKAIGNYRFENGLLENTDRILLDVNQKKFYFIKGNTVLQVFNLSSKELSEYSGEEKNYIAEANSLLYKNIIDDIGLLFQKDHQSFEVVIGESKQNCSNILEKREENEKKTEEINNSLRMYLMDLGASDNFIKKIFIDKGNLLFDSSDLNEKTKEVILTESRIRAQYLLNSYRKAKEEKKEFLKNNNLNEETFSELILDLGHLIRIESKYDEIYSGNRYVYYNLDIEYSEKGFHFDKKNIQRLIASPHFKNLYNLISQNKSDPFKIIKDYFESYSKIYDILEKFLGTNINQNDYKLILDLLSKNLSDEDIERNPIILRIKDATKWNMGIKKSVNQIINNNSGAYLDYYTNEVYNREFLAIKKHHDNRYMTIPLYTFDKSGNIILETFGNGDYFNIKEGKANENKILEYINGEKKSENSGE